MQHKLKIFQKRLQLEDRMEQVPLGHLLASLFKAAALFKAAVTSLLARNNGEKLVTDFLPGYVNI